LVGRVELEVYAHKVRHLKFETDVDVSQVRADTDAVIETGHQIYRAKVERAEKGKVAALGELDDQVETTHESLAHLSRQTDSELRHIKDRHAVAVTAFETTCSERLRQLHDDLETQRRVELSEIEDRKNDHLNTLMSNHQAAFKEMRDYYQGVTQDNCGLIKRYEDELIELKISQQRNAELLRAASGENNRLREPLAQVRCLSVIISFFITRGNSGGKYL
jgi:hypothetical protein